MLVSDSLDQQLSRELMKSEPSESHGNYVQIDVLGEAYVLSFLFLLKLWRILASVHLYSYSPRNIAGQLLGYVKRDITLGRNL